MKKEHQLKYISQLLKKNKEWICGYDILTNLEVSLECLFNAYADGLPVYDSDMTSRIYPRSLLDENVLYDGDAQIRGCIDFDKDKEIIYLDSHNLPVYINFEINELTGMWRLLVDSTMLGFDEISELGTSREQTFVIKMVKLNNFYAFQRDKHNFDINVRAVHKLAASATSIRSGSSIQRFGVMLIDVLYNGLHFYGVPQKHLRKALKILSVDGYENEKYLSAASEIAYFYFYDIPTCKDGEFVMSDAFNITDYANTYNISYSKAKHELTLDQKDLYVKLEDLSQYIRNLKERDIQKCIAKWTGFTAPPECKYFEPYKEFAIQKLEGASLKELFSLLHDKGLSTATSDAAQDTACSKFGDRVKKFARNNNLPIWPENRGRPAGKPG